MNRGLLTPADLADDLGVTVRKVMEWRRVYGWPCVQIGRVFRFTPEQRDAIIARHAVTPVVPAEETSAVGIGGQTKRSASRRRSA